MKDLWENNQRNTLLFYLFLSSIVSGVDAFYFLWWAYSSANSVLKVIVSSVHNCVVYMWVHIKHDFMQNYTLKIFLNIVLKTQLLSCSIWKSISQVSEQKLKTKGTHEVPTERFEIASNSSTLVIYHPKIAILPFPNKCHYDWDCYKFLLSGLTKKWNKP